MPDVKVTVSIVGGSEKENLSYVTVGDKRWGLNGSKYGTGQQVATGASVAVAAGYTNGTYNGTQNIQNACTLNVTAGGPNNTGIAQG